MFRYILLVLLGWSATVDPSVEHVRWAASGLPGLNVKSLAADRNLMYAATFGQGVFVSSDAGETWGVCNKGLKNLNVFSLAFHKQSVIAGTKDGVYAMRDTGEGWKQMAGMPDETRAYSLVSSGEHVYAGSRQGLYVWSGSGGWVLKKLQAAEDPYVYGISLVAGEIYAGTQGQGLFKSWDNAETWMPTAKELPASQTIGFLLYANKKLYAATDGAGVYVSGNLKEWQSINAGLKSLKVFHLLSQKDQLYASTLDGVYRWTTEIKTWTPLNNDGMPGGVVINSLIYANERLFAATEKGVFVKNTD